MENNYYLTDNLFINNNKIKYLSKNKEKCITHLNWHHHLAELGWKKLYKQWILKLNKLTQNKYKNSPFGYIDCGEEGNCLFHCIAFAKSDLLQNKIYTQKDIRNILAENLTQEYFQQIIEIYRIMSISEDFSEEWDPNKINTLDDFRKEIILGGNNYWGDHIIIQLLCKILNINILILNTNLFEGIYEKYNYFQEYNEQNDTIVLIYLDDSHFQILGHYKDSMIHYIFNDKNLPLEIRLFFGL
tara:strand:- start:977 stop:1705 length:729 start_codon:yes stop_codon:yes gene_type:complete